jgi:hypothetical protein
MAAPAEPPSTFKTVHVAGSCLLILVGAGLAACGTYQNALGSATPLLPFFCSSFSPFLLSSFSSFLCCRMFVRLLVYLLPIKGKTTPHSTRSTPSCPQSTHMCSTLRVLGWAQQAVVRQTHRRVRECGMIKKMVQIRPLPRRQGLPCAGRAFLGPNVEYLVNRFSGPCDFQQSRPEGV